MPKTKAELLKEANELGAPVDANMTNAEIEEAIEKAREDDAEDEAAQADQVDAERAKVLAAAGAQGAGDGPTSESLGLEPDADDALDQGGEDVEDDTPNQELMEANKVIAENTAEIARLQAEVAEANARARVAATPEASEAGEPGGAPDLSGLQLQDMPAGLLQQLRGVIDKALGKAKPKQAPSLGEVVGVYPENRDAVKDVSIERAAKVAKLDKKEILAYTVRQQRGADGEFYGDSYLRVVTHRGKKLTVKL